MTRTYLSRPLSNSVLKRMHHVDVAEVGGNEACSITSLWENLLG
jgi:hypothetical protein